MPSAAKRVAIVYHCFPHYRHAVMTELWKRSRNGLLFAADVVAPDRSIKVWPIPPDLPFIRLRGVKLGRLVFHLGAVRIAFRRDVDRIIYHNGIYWPLIWISAICARLMGKRVYFWGHGWVRREQGLKRFIRCWLNRIGHAHLLYGHLAKIIAIEDGFAPERLHVIYNSLDYDQQKQIRKGLSEERVRQLRIELFSDPDRPVVVCPTRLVAVRRLDLLLEAVSLLDKKGKRLNLLLIGDGPERPRLQQLAQEYGLAVHFYGACYDEQVLGDLIGTANVTVAPGKVGLTAMHSLAYGTPVITHDDADDQMPEWEAIVAGVNGDLFQRGNIEDLARVIDRWTPSVMPAQKTRNDCYRMLDRFYNPQFQRRAIDRALDGKPADDLFWMKEPLDRPRIP